jgi:aerobic-type carbon monoxide dehydrogenase small subunit (CoxS/CutS family)
MNKPHEVPVAQSLHLSVNGRSVAVHSPARRLADTLRDDLGLTGTKIGCNAGDCGACTVLLDGEQVCACIIATGQCAGREITTVEGLASGGELSPLQQVFIAHGAAQCGICTPGMLMAATDVLQRHPHPTEQQVLDGIGGVLCRCTGYRKIVEAVLAVSDASLSTAPLVPDAGDAVRRRGCARGSSGCAQQSDWCSGIRCRSLSARLFVDAHSTLTASKCPF